MISGKKALFIIPALILSVVPAHAAKPITKVATKVPKINVINQSSYTLKPDYNTLRKYLIWINRYWKIYRGDYNIYLVDHYPEIYKDHESSASGFHAVDPNTGKPVAYVKMTKSNGWDTYIVLSHELAEMAVDPYLDLYDLNGEIVEICDGDNGWTVFNNRLVENFKVPSDFNLP